MHQEAVQFLRPLLHIPNRRLNIHVCHEDTQLHGIQRSCNIICHSGTAPCSTVQVGQNQQLGAGLVKYILYRDDDRQRSCLLYTLDQLLLGFPATTKGKSGYAQ